MSDPQMLIATDTRCRERRVTELVLRHQGFVERVLKRYGVGDADVPDARQSTFIAVANRLDDIIPAAERSFLFQAARHTALHVLRRMRRHRFAPLEDDLPSSLPSPEQAVTEKLALTLLRDVVEGLPERSRTVFVLFEFQNLNVVEIADRLQIPQGTAASRLRCARQQVRLELRRREALTRRRAFLLARGRGLAATAEC